MSEREPAILGGEGGSPQSPPDESSRAAVAVVGITSTAKPSEIARPGRRDASVVHVVGFWKRWLAATIDFFIVAPAALLMMLLVSKLAGIDLPTNLSILDIDLWIDLVLRTDPALVMALVMFISISLLYALVFQITVGRTLGMRVLKMRIIDVYGDRPSPGRCVARCGGYLVSVATLFLGFLWMGFDSEKRGLQDWIAGTYVIRA